MQKEAIKAAKKSLKKADSSMKLKKLAKKVSGELKEVSEEQIRKWIQESDKFHVDGKTVSLKRKKEAVESPTKKMKFAVDESDVPAWRKEHKIVVMHSADDKHRSEALASDEALFPYCSFTMCKNSIDKSLIDQCTVTNGFARPSPIQAQSWPIMNARRDMVGIAETGSGKTLAFALPILSSMSQSKRAKKPRMLVLSPTRELAMQSDVVLQEFGKVVQISSMVVYGGVPKHQQVATLRRGVDCIVATPGRLKDLLQEGSCDLGSIEYLVLDEADRMLDMGFEEDVRFIMSCCKDKQARQTVMFSATWPAVIQKIALEYMKDPIRVYVGFESIVGSNGEGGVDDSLSANTRVSQTVEVLEDRQRETRLRQILDKVHGKRSNRVLVFALYKKEAERLEFSLKRQGWNCCSIHGNKNQAARTAALASFKDGSCPLMVATDVAARGLDIPNVEVVINFTFPLTIEDYVHRIGRTGRAGKTGVSYTFFQPTDKSHAGELQQVMKQAGQSVPEDLMKFGSTIKKKEHKLYGNFGPRDDGKPMKKATKITFNYDD